MIPIPVTPELLQHELQGARAILDKWIQQINDGIPGVTIPTTSEEAFENWMVQFCGELMVCAGKCETISHIMSENRGGSGEY